MTRILLVEDHPIMSAGTRQMFRKYLPDAEIVEVDNFWKALQAAEASRFELAVMDIGIPGGDSTQMVEKFRRKCPSTRLLMLSGYDEQIYALPFIQAGADGFVSKKAPEAELWAAVESILFRNKVYISEAVRDLTLERYIKPRQGQDGDAIASLSSREKQILQLLYDRKGVSEIGRLLNLSTSTVNTFRIRIMKKFGVDTTSDLVKTYEILSRRSEEA